MKRSVALLSVLSLFIAVFAQKSIPNKTNIILKDFNGKSWNVDSLLDAGQHMVVQQMFAG
ncbi:MAG: hypothetical protein JW795_17970 [Chitinivibrionales bacterium]|nr:hypothetical protein [Chitinivibrionales bacterium]